MIEHTEVTGEPTFAIADERRAFVREEEKRARVKQRQAWLDQVYCVADDDTCNCCEKSIPRDGTWDYRQRYVLFDSDNVEDRRTDGKLCFSCWHTTLRWVEEAKRARVEQQQTSDEQQQARLDTYRSADRKPCDHCGALSPRDRTLGHRFRYVFADSDDGGGWLAHGGLCPDCWETVHQWVTEAE